MKKQREKVVGVFIFLLMMNNAVGIHGSHSPESSTNSSNSHKHRHHHHHNQNLRGRFNNSKGLHVSEKPTGSWASNNLYDQLRRPLQKNDDGVYEGISNVSKRQSYLPHSTTVSTSASYFSTGSNSSHTLMFQKRPKNNSAIVTTFKPPTFYIHSNIRSSKTNNNIGLPDYHDTKVVPFNTDEGSEHPYFDVEFFPEELTPHSSNRNRTLPSLHDGSYSRPPFTPWELPSGDIESISQHLHTTIASRPFNGNPFYNTNITKSIFSQHEVHREIDYIIPSLNFSSVLESEFNTSSERDPVGASVDDLYTWSILMMAPLVLFGVGGNTLVILAISLEKRLQNVTNYFLLSLAVTDLLVSIIVMPFSIINVFTGRWLFGLLLCDFFVTSDVLMCTSSILHLCTISLERYIGIRYPLWTKYKSKKIVLLKIVLVWTIALAITSPITVLGVIKQENVLVRGECVLSNAHFIIYGSTFAFFIPLTIMVVMYVLTVRMLNKQAMMCQSRRADDRGGQVMIRRSTSRRNWQPRRKYYDPSTFSTGSSCSGTRLVDENTTIVMTDFRQNSYRSSGVNRHNTIPVGHYRYSEFTRKNIAGSGNGSVGGSNSSLHRGRSNMTIPSGKSSLCSIDGGNSTTHIRVSGRRKRYSSQNGTSNTGYGTGGTSYGTNSTSYEQVKTGYRTGNTAYTGLNPSPEFQYSNGLQKEVANELQSDSQNCCSSRLSSSSSSSSPTSSTNREHGRPRDKSRKHHVAVKAASILLMKRDNSDQSQGHSPGHTSSTRASVRKDNSVRTEQKASKVLGVVFMIFVICWAPFFTVNILTAMCTTCEFESTLVTAFVWLGYVSSTLNPIIYTIFNNIFRITFIKLLCCRYRLLHRARRSSTLPGVRNGLLNFSDFSPALLTTTTAVNTTSSTFVEESNC